MDRNRLPTCSAFVLLGQVSSIRLNTIADYMHHGVLVGVRCRSCGHQINFEPTNLYWLFLRRRWPIKVDQAARRFRCQKCGVRNSEIQQGGLA